MGIGIVTPRKIATFMGYRYSYEEELKLVIPDWWNNATKRQRSCLQAIIDHIKYVNVNHSKRKDLFILQVENGIGMGFGDKTWKRVIDECGLFRTYDVSYSKVRGKAKLYEFTELGYDFLRLEEAILTNSFDPVLEILYGDELLRFKENAIPQRVRNRDDSDYKINCVLDYRVLESFLINEQEEEHPKCDLTQALLLIKRLRQSRGKITQRYKRIGSGRLYGMKNSNLQNLPRLVREKLFAGYYDVDMVNAHYHLAYQMYCKAYLHYPEYLSEYAKNRSCVRQKVAKELGIGADDVKTCLLILLYGGGRQFGPNIQNPYSKEIGDRKAIEFLEHPFVAGLDEEIQDLIEAIKPELNQIIVGRKLRIPTLRSALAFKLQQIESEILDICVRLYEPEALYFDGFITKEDVDPEVLEEYVAANHEYKMNFESTLLEIAHE